MFKKAELEQKSLEKEVTFEYEFTREDLIFLEKLEEICFPSLRQLEEEVTKNGSYNIIIEDSRGGHLPSLIVYEFLSEIQEKKPTKPLKTFEKRPNSVPKGYLEPDIYFSKKMSKASLWILNKNLNSENPKIIIVTERLDVNNSRGNISGIIKSFNLPQADLYALSAFDDKHPSNFAAKKINEIFCCFESGNDKFIKEYVGGVPDLTGIHNVKCYKETYSVRPPFIKFTLNFAARKKEQRVRAIAKKVVADYFLRYAINPEIVA